MKILLMGVLTLLFVFETESQSFNGKGDSKINVGYNIYGYGNGINASYNYGLNDQFSIGAGGSYYFDNEENDYFLFARANFHLGPLMDLPRKLDIYPGVEFGYLSSENIGLAAYIGVRYFFTDRLGVYAEIGSSGSVGMSLCI